jgi:hypothetical protein
MMSMKAEQTMKENPSICRLGRTQRNKNEEGAKSGVWRLERMKHGSGIKGREDKSSGIEILIAEAFAKSSPTEP